MRYSTLVRPFPLSLAPGFSRMLPSGEARRACLKIPVPRRVRARGLQDLAAAPAPCRPGALTGRVLRPALSRFNGFDGRNIPGSSEDKPPKRPRLSDLPHPKLNANDPRKFRLTDNGSAKREFRKSLQSLWDSSFEYPSDFRLKRGANEMADRLLGNAGSLATHHDAGSRYKVCLVFPFSCLSWLIQSLSP